MSLTLSKIPKTGFLVTWLKSVCLLYSMITVFYEYNKKINELEHDKTNKMTNAHGEDSDQPGYPPSLVSLRCALFGNRTKTVFRWTG